MPSKFLITLTTCSIITALCTIAVANDAEYSGYAGTPAPIENDSVRMKSEDIEFIEKKGEWRVEAVYVFENMSDEEVELVMGYPEIAGDSPGGFRRLKTYVRDKPIKTRKRKSGPMTKTFRSKGYRLGRVHLFDVTFAPGESVEVRHEFRMDGGGSVALACEKEISYITRTGKLWRGPIGRAQFTISMARVPDIVTIPKGYKIKSYGRRLERKGAGTRTTLVLENEDWTPEEDLTVVMASSCGGSSEMAVLYTGAECPGAWDLEEERGKKLDVPKALEKYSSDQLRLCRNMVYARYGYTFKDKSLNALFYKHKPGDVVTYPPHYCSNPDEPQEYCRPERAILYTRDLGYEPKMLTREENRYVKLLKNEERRRKASSTIPGADLTK